MAYNGHRGPNVSEFIANLNAIPPAQELAEPEFNFDADLAMFTNTTFFDFDLGHNADLQPDMHFDMKPQQIENTQNNNAGTPVDFSKTNMDFLQSDFAFPDFSSFSHQHTDGYQPVDGLSNIQNQHSVYPASTSGSSPNSGLISPQNGVAYHGEKRKADEMIAGTPAYGSQTFEEASRLAAEEDKRRRNTAASARFRVKKKQREQALERSAKEMTDKVTALESRITQLETENKWLKNLVMEKNDNKEDLAALWKKYTAENTGSKADTTKKGVGTEQVAKPKEEKVAA